MQETLEILKALADSTRLRLLRLCNRSDLTVGNMTSILGQSQPSISRHLKIMDKAGLLERRNEGQNVYFRITRDVELLGLIEPILNHLSPQDSVLTRDEERLHNTLAARAKIAHGYFAKHAERWHKVRNFYNDCNEAEQLFLTELSNEKTKPKHYLDLGTGTGQLLQAVAKHVQNATGIDISREMLTVARAMLDREQLRNACVQEADIYTLPFDKESFDAVGLYQVLHFLEEPGQAIKEASKVLCPKGKLIILDYAQHKHNELAQDFAHIWPGFSDEEIKDWLSAAGLELVKTAKTSKANPQVQLWVGQA